jgi:hypothetical protein
MPKAKRAIPNEVLKFTFSPDEALLRCAYTKLPVSRKKSVKTRLKSR